VSDDVVTIRVRRSHLYVAIGLLIGFVGGVAVGRTVLSPKPTASTVASAVSTLPTGPVKVSIAGRPFWGPKNAKVTVVEFTDYQCPFCGRHFKETLPGLRTKYASQIKYVIRNFPIASLHPFAQKAAEAAECVLAQSEPKFWEYHDTLFKNQDKLTITDLKRYAATLGLNTSKFDRCLDSGAQAGEVSKDIADGTGIGVTGTPTFVINGEVLKGAVALSIFETYITKHLND